MIPPVLSQLGRCGAAGMTTLVAAVNCSAAPEAGEKLSAFVRELRSHPTDLQNVCSLSELGSLLNLVS
jgi:hypothetical protein